MATEAAITAFIGVGSNIEPDIHIPQALERVHQIGRVTGVSTFYQTLPLRHKGQPLFTNGVWRIETSIPPRSLKYDWLRVIESDLGRVRVSDRYAPRTIDLDIVLHGEALIDEPGLTIPDPDIRLRPFIALPLLELEPHLVLPDTREPLALIARQFDKTALKPAVELTRHLKQSVLSRESDNHGSL